MECGGLHKCLDDQDFLNCIYQYDILFFSETWQRQGESFELEGYECVHVPRKESGSKKCKRGHGGVCLFVHESVRKGIELLETNDSGFIWVKLSKLFFNLTDDICICFAYIPPQDSIYFKTHDIGFYELLEENIRKYSALGKISIIGDLNARCGRKSDIIQDTHIYDKYIPSMDAYGINNEPINLTERASMDSV